MQTVSLAEMKAKLSDYGERAARGEEIIVTRYGKPAFRLMPLTQERFRYANSGRMKGDPAQWAVPVYTDEELAEFGIG